MEDKKIKLVLNGYKTEVVFKKNATFNELLKMISEIKIEEAGKDELQQDNKILVSVNEKDINTVQDEELSDAVNEGLQQQMQMGASEMQTLTETIDKFKFTETIIQQSVVDNIFNATSEALKKTTEEPNKAMTVSKDIKKSNLPLDEQRTPEFEVPELISKVPNVLKPAIPVD